MKVLLDENIDIRFKKAFANTEHKVYTVRDLGWNGITNGKLLQKLKEAQFDILVAVDKNLPYQQNENSLTVAIFILDVKKNVLTNILPFVPKLLISWEQPLENRFYLLTSE